MSDPSDNIELTDNYAAGYRGGWKDATTHAAARIEALEAALQKIIENNDHGSYESTGQAINEARAALAEGQDTMTLASARAVKRKVSQHALQVQLLAKFEVRKARDINILALANAGHRSLRMGARMKAEGLQAGAADLLVMLPGGRAAWLELKTATGRQSLAQKGFEAKCRRLGASLRASADVGRSDRSTHTMGSLKMSTTDTEHREPTIRLSRDLVKASSTMTTMEARYLVDAYYLMQDDRKRAHNQVRAMEEEPHSVIGWLAGQSETLEGQIKRALDQYSDSHPAGAWLKSHYGIGPVIAAGLLAHIDIRKAPTVGHIWRFAGLDPTLKWEKGQKRPFNAELKTLCWKLGQSFMKFSGKEECIYGAVYREHKAKYVARNEAGDYAARSAEILTEKKFRAETDAFKHLSGASCPRRRSMPAPAATR